MHGPDDLERVAGEVAHDLNNLLTVILGYTDLVIHDLGPDHLCSGDLQAVQRAADQARALVDKLLVVSRHSVVHASNVDLTIDLRGGHERVLLVEDDDEVRAFAQRVLTEHGYVAEGIADGAEAMALLEDGDRPDVVVTDVQMPAMSGVELAERMRDVAPDTPVLFVSGYAEDPRLPRLVVEAPFLPKPFSAGDLLRAVRHAIDGRAPQGSKR